MHVQISGRRDSKIQKKFFNSKIFYYFKYAISKTKTIKNNNQNPF